ncbi:MAG: SDR family NAD(P)-dependent oxidoreductase [Alphaproteobacteria bacterium]|jgi:NAD(P)-dependent dehydrogenase (short-subunit alcohol dehydrogenase family)
MLDPKGRVALISGANRGIGLAIAAELFAQGWSLSLGLRDPAGMTEKTAGWEVSRLHIARYDAHNWASHQAWVDAALTRFGRIDALINNAGISSKMTIRDADETVLDDIWAVNCKAPLSMIKSALPALEASGSGRILNVASMSGKRVRNDNVAYNMSKFAVLALTHAARRLSWDKGVRATAICPSFVRTDMTADATKIGRNEMIDPSDFAVLAATVLALPNNAAVAELLVNCRLEDML